MCEQKLALLGIYPFIVLEEGKIYILKGQPLHLRTNMMYIFKRNQCRVRRHDAVAELLRKPVSVAR